MWCWCMRVSAWWPYVLTNCLRCRPTACGVWPTKNWANTQAPCGRGRSMAFALSTRLPSGSRRVRHVEGDAAGYTAHVDLHAAGAPWQTASRAESESFKADAVLVVLSFIWAALCGGQGWHRGSRCPSFLAVRFGLAARAACAVGMEGATSTTRPRFVARRCGAGRRFLYVGFLTQTAALQQHTTEARAASSQVCACCWLLIAWQLLKRESVFFHGVEWPWRRRGQWRRPKHGSRPISVGATVAGVRIGVCLSYRLDGVIWPPTPRRVAGRRADFGGDRAVAGELAIASRA